MPYQPATDRYQAMVYRRCGRSGSSSPRSRWASEQLRGGRVRRERARADLPRLRSRHHPFRSRQQLRTAPGAAEESLGGS